MGRHRTPAPVPFGPVPSARQLAWHALEFYGFLHFTVNTFTDKEWGYGDESPSIFNPSAFDAEQMARAAKRAGMRGLILTCKHHDGFCLWPSAHTKHSVRASPWRKGRGDVVREVSDACRRRGLRFGVYLSPWDRNHAEYGRPAYLAYYRAQLRELLTQYGRIFEVWFDGANGGDGFYGGARERREIDRRTYYGWPDTWRMVRDLQPGACMFSDAGPDVRWVGNESGVAGETCWSTLNAADFTPGQADTKRLNAGDRPGTHWLPAECDVSIRPGWFFHAAEDDKVRSPENLVDLYFRSVGRGASFLLNLPPDRRGRVHENDVRALEGFRERIDAIFADDLAARGRAEASCVRGGDRRFAAACLTDGDPGTYWSTDDGVTRADATLSFRRPVSFDVVSLREHLPLGQRVEAFAVDVWAGSRWRRVAAGTGIGNRRLVRLARPATAERVRLRITRAAACPAVSGFGLHLSPAGA